MWAWSVAIYNQLLSIALYSGRYPHAGVSIATGRVTIVTVCIFCMTCISMETESISFFGVLWPMCTYCTCSNYLNILIARTASLGNLLPS